MEEHDTQPYQIPDITDSLVYEKPNAYDNVAENFQEVETLAIMTPEEDIKDQNGATDDNQKSIEITPPGMALLSRAAAMATTQTVTMSGEGSSMTSPFMSPSVSKASANSYHSNNDISEGSISKQRLEKSLRKKSKEEMVILQLRKQSLLQAQNHIIFQEGSTKKTIYLKQQSHSYAWGFQNVLFRSGGDIGDNVENKVAEAKRAFEKEIVLTWGDFEKCITCSAELRNTTNTHLLFTYESMFEEYRVRWKRTSLLSHDLVCELARQGAGKNEWRRITSFDSHGMGYLVRLGQLAMDRQALNLMKRPDQFEAVLVLTCCTLVDLMREMIQKAVGISGGGGVIGSG